MDGFADRVAEGVKLAVEGVTFGGFLSLGLLGWGRGGGVEIGRRTKRGLIRGWETEMRGGGEEMGWLESVRWIG